MSAFTKKGYYNTTTAEIAKFAGVSTGIVYSYFKDKKDIFLQSLDLYFANLYSPVIDKLKTLSSSNLETSLKEIINLTISSHSKNASSHEEFVAMSHLDEDVHESFMLAEFKLTECILECLKNNNISIENTNEKVHIIYNLVESLCHEFVFHKHEFINYEFMTNETIKTIMFLINN